MSKFISTERDFIVKPKTKSNVFVKAGFNPNQTRDSDGKWSKKPGPLKDRPCFKEWFGDSKIKKANGDPKPVYHGGPDKITAFDDRYAGDTTGNNDHGAFYFSDQKGVAEDYSRQAFKRRYRDNPESLIDEGYVKELPEFEGYDDQYAFVDELADENINVVEAYMRMENPIILDARWENLNAVRKQVNIQNLIGALKGEPVDEFPEMLYDYLDPETYDWLDGVAPDGIIIKNVIDDIGPGSAGFQDVHIALDPNQIKSVDAKSFCHETDIRKSVLVNGKELKAGFKENQRRDRSGKWTDKWAGMRKFEDSIRKDKTETAGVYDKDGNELVVKKGDKDSVYFGDVPNWYRMPIHTLTHNHPNSTSFSLPDMQMLVQGRLKVIRAFGRKRGYEIEITSALDALRYLDPKYGISAMSAMNNAFYEAQQEIFPNTNIKISNINEGNFEEGLRAAKVRDVYLNESHLLVDWVVRNTDIGQKLIKRYERLY